MGFYAPCHNCVLEWLPCPRRAQVAAGIKGLGLTAVKFRCAERQPLFAVGQRVVVQWLVPTGDSDGGHQEDYLAEEWPATVVAERSPKFQILVDDVSSDEGTPARDYIKNESLYAKVTAGKLRALNEPPRAVCSACGVVANGGEIEGCRGYDKEAGGGFAYTPRGCLKASLAPVGTRPEGGDAEGGSMRSTSDAVPKAGAQPVSSQRLQGLCRPGLRRGK